MRSTEDKKQRIEMVDMHQFFLNKIDAALKEKRYIEATWLIYACVENRFFRVLNKYKTLCKKCTGKCKKNSNELALSTKIACVKRLCENNVLCLSNAFTLSQLDDIRVWAKNRNKLMHKLLSLDTYKNSDEEFKKSAIEGQKLLKELYASCTKYRKLFYANDYEFVFPESAMEQCTCGDTNKPKEGGN